MVPLHRHGTAGHILTVGYLHLQLPYTHYCVIMRLPASLSPVAIFNAHKRNQYMVIIAQDTMICVATPFSGRNAQIQNNNLAESHHYGCLAPQADFFDDAICCTATYDVVDRYPLPPPPFAVGPSTR